MKKNSILTLISISILAWILANMFHEIAGHAGMGLITGLDLKAVNSTTAYFDVNWDQEIDQNGFFRYRLFLAGGVLLNLVSGLIAIILLKRDKVNSPNMRFFLWLLASFCLVIVVMNLVTVPFTGGGDFGGIIKTFDNENPAKIIVLLTGLLIMVFAYRQIQKSFMPVFKAKRRLLFSFTAIPVLTIIITQSLSIVQSPFASLPPSQNHLLASVFAYFHFILWLIVINLVPLSNKTKSIEEVMPVKSYSWIIIGLTALVFFIFILGPGIGSFDSHPALN